MNRVFIDTNVILDHILQREHGAEAKTLIEWLFKNKVQMMMSVGGFYTMHYIIEKYLRQELLLDKESRTIALRALLSSILQTFTVAEHDNASLLQGVSDVLYTDLEDSFQHQLAMKSGCEMLITFNDKHFPSKDTDNSFTIMTPQHFINTYINR